MAPLYESCMRMKQAAITAAAMGAIAAIAGGIYLFSDYGARAPREFAPLPPPSTATTGTRSGKAFSLSVLKTPRSLPELSFVNGEGREMTLKALRGHTVLLNIWATWCVPCREEMPALDRLEAKLGGPDFRVVPLSIDRDGLPIVKAFYQELGLEALGIYVDQSGKTARQVGTVGIPTTLLIDREGREIGRTVGPAKWDSEEVLQALSKFVPQAAEVGGRDDKQ